MYLDRSINFFKARRTREVPVPEFGEGCVVIIRELGVAQAAVAQVDKDLVKQLAMMIIDADGNQIYRTPEDLVNLAEMPAAISNRIFEAANSLSGAAETAQKETLKN